MFKATPHIYERAGSKSRCFLFTLSAYNLAYAMNPGQDQVDAPETSGMRRQKICFQLLRFKGKEHLASILARSHQQQTIAVHIAFVKVTAVPRSPVG